MQFSNPFHLSLPENNLNLMSLIITSIALIMLFAAVFVAKKKTGRLRRDLDAYERTLITVLAEVKSQEVYRFAEIGRESAELVHDLANPLTALLCSLDDLETRYGPATVRPVRDSVSYIEKCLTSVRRRLKEQNERRLFCARSEVMKVIGFFEQKATKNNIGINARLSEVKLYGESSRFGQIVSNLVDNAIDSYEGLDETSKTIKVELKPGDGQKIILSVADNGIGMSTPLQEEIFEPFFSTKPSHKGTGLGLAITRQIVEDDFAGSLRLVSSPGAGTVFYVELPQQHHDF